MLFDQTSGRSNLFGLYGKVVIWRTPREDFDRKCTTPTIKHSGGSVMIWGCFSRQGVEKLRVLDRIKDRFYY